MILAIDQGSSKTHALIGDEQGHVLGTGLAEGACHFLVGMEASMKAVRSAAARALRQAGLAEGNITCVSAGMSGANWPDEFELLTQKLRTELGVEKVTVYNDCVPALYAGTQSPNAVILCAGTEFNAAVLKNRKLVWIYNNYTELMDKGGKSLGTRALQGAFRSITHMGPETTLLKRAMEFFEYDDQLALLLDFSRNTLPKPVKDFAVVVDEEAMKCDRVALEVQYEFGKSLSRYAIGAMKRFDMICKPIDIVLNGGLFKARSRVMMDVICAEVHRVSPLARMVEAQYEPVVGAYELALDPKAEEKWRPCIRQDASRYSLERF